MLKQLLKILNGMVTEAELVMSASMFSLLSKMKHPMAKLILDIHQGKIDIGDNSYVDVHPEKLGDITMLSHRRLERIPQEEIWTTRSRVDSGVGKLVRALLLKYGYTNDNGTLKKEGSDDVTGRDVELFVSEFKALQQAGTEEESNFKLVSGEEIRKWYHQKNYMDDEGTLGGSCMRYSKCQAYLDIYCNEPKVKMLIYTDLDSDGNEKLLGRALIWEETYIKHPDKEDEMVIFMDRIYYNETHLEEVFKKYAQEQNWWYKVQQSYQNRAGITNGTDTMEAKMYVKLTKNYYNELTPYLDTFAYMKEATGTIWNYQIASTHKVLTDTEGNLSDEDEEYCDSCGGDRRWNCDECNEGKVECGNCDGDGERTCNTCNGDYENVECNNCDGNGNCYKCEGNGKCYHCDGTMKVKCQECLVLKPFEYYKNTLVRDCSRDDRLVMIVNGVTSEHRSLFDHVSIYDLMCRIVIVKHNLRGVEGGFEISDIDDATLRKAEAIIVATAENCDYCENGIAVCGTCNLSSNNRGKCNICTGSGICKKCDGKTTRECPDCEEGKDTCYRCDGNGDVDCDSCAGHGYFECDWC
jgi:hypothetical protein